MLQMYSLSWPRRRPYNCTSSNTTDLARELIAFELAMILADGHSGYWESILSMWTEARFVVQGNKGKATKKNNRKYQNVGSGQLNATVTSVSRILLGRLWKVPCANLPQLS